MLTLEQKREQAPESLVRAADLISELIQTSSRKMTCHRQERKIRQLLDGFPESIHWKVRPTRIDLFDGSFKESHAHVAICQLSGHQYYWRNKDEPHGGDLNYFR